MRNALDMLNNITAKLNLKNDGEKTLESEKTDFVMNEYEIDEKTAYLINYVFERLIGVVKFFRYSVDSMVSMESLRREYSYALMENKISDITHINRAISKIRQQGVQFIPTPFEFVNFCRPTAEELGAPSLNAAYDNAIFNLSPYQKEKKWLHPVVKYATELCSDECIERLPAQKSKSIFEEAYKRACSDYVQGKILNQLTDERTPEAYQEYIGGQLADIRLGIVENFKIPDFQEWKSNPKYV